MSLALFRSTLRTAIRDALADDAPQSAAGTAASEPRVPAGARRRISRLDLVAHDGRRVTGQTS
jgi:hypothetical protein